LATTSDNQDKVRIFLSDGAGGFGAPTDVLTGAGTSAGALVAGNWDGDLDMDLAVALKGPNTVRLLVNAGNGTFSLGGEFSVGDRPVDLEAADLDGDGDPDLASANRDGESVTVLLNTGGSFSSTTLSVGGGTEPRAIASGNFDTDSDRDLAVALHDSRSVQLLINQGAGSFALGGSLSVGGQVRPEGLVAADLDRDQDMDLVAATSGNGLNQLGVFLFQGGGFQGPVNYPTTGTNPSSVIAHDLDSDLDVDLAVVNEDSHNVSVLGNAGNGTFGAAQLVAVNGTTPGHLVAGDFDRSGTLDLVTSNRDSNNVSVFFNRKTPWTDLGFGLAGTNGVPVLAG
ncbi:MAG: VCBS repeat-containing protein, partial [Sporichthyaceae bacterium]|nr:VCBS repeat-containing protein [Sporichthyaceae bacterium]